MNVDVTMNGRLNERVIDLIKTWQKGGAPEQEGFDWSSSRHNWEKAFPENREFISVLPAEIDRQAVRSFCESATNSIREKFLSVMIWGYGDRGYGPYRVTQMLNQPHAEPTLGAVFKLAQSGAPIEAYEFLKSNRIRILGPSYGSKFITFCTPRSIGAPIYDSFIALWVAKFAASEFSDVPVTSENWNVKTYSRYWTWVKAHSEKLKCYPDQIELVLFRDAEREFSKSSTWISK